MESQDRLNEVIELIDKTWQRVDQYYLNSKVILAEKILEVSSLLKI